MLSNTLLGLPGGPVGYSPNSKPNNSQTVLTNGFALNGILSISGTVYAGYMLSKANLTANGTTFGLPTSASVVAGNLWLLTEGIVPDTLQMDTVQGDTNGAPSPYVTGDSVNVIPFPENGTVVQAGVYLANAQAITVNSALYVRTDGALTVNAADASIASAAYSVGYILQADFTSAPAAGVYQMQVVINPRYVLQD
jgi:hypothetical protein